MSPLRDIAFVLILIPLVPMCAMRPWIGVLAWYWIAFMVPHSLTWGFARSLPVAVLIGGATLLGFLLSNDRKRIPRTWTIYFLVAFVADFTLTTILAHNTDYAWGKWNWVSKVLLMTFVTMCLFQDRERLRWLYMVVALSLGFYGFKGGFWVLRTGGGEIVYGPDLSSIQDNNGLGLALCMGLPLILYLSREEPRLWLKRTLKVIFAFSIIAILFTYSRGAFLALTVVLGILIWRSPWRGRFGMGLLVVSLIAIPILPERLSERIGSITKQDSAETRDQSVAGRFEAWTTAWNIARARPFTGAGFRALWNEDIWEYYYGPNYITTRDAHSIYFEVLSEHGFVGLGLYLLIIASLLVTLRRIRKKWRGHSEHGYLSNYAEMTQLSLYPFLIAGAFLSMAYFDLYFFFVATVVMLQGLSIKAEKAVARETAPPLPPRLRLKTRRAPALVPRRTPPPLPSRRHA